MGEVVEVVAEEKVEEGAVGVVDEAVITVRTIALPRITIRETATAIEKTRTSLTITFQHANLASHLSPTRKRMARREPTLTPSRRKPESSLPRS